jgi:chromate transporter
MAFSGIRVAVCALILNSILKLSKKSVIDKVTLIIFIAIIGVLFFSNLSTILVVLIGILLGLLTSAIIKKSKKEKGIN